MLVDVEQKTNVGSIKYKKFIPVCPSCEKELIEVSRTYNVPFYSCKNEECKQYAELVLNVGSNKEPMIVGFYDILTAANSVVDTTQTPPSGSNTE